LEILIAVALIGIVFITLLGIGFTSVKISTAIQKETQADSLIKEEFEALRSFRDSSDWATNGLGVVSTGSGNPYYMFLDTSTNPAHWSAANGTETIGIFTRKIVFDQVYRDFNGDIAPSGTLDSDTIKATITVSWLDRSYQTVAYFTNWQK